MKVGQVYLNFMFLKGFRLQFKRPWLYIKHLNRRRTLFTNRLLLYNGSIVIFRVNVDCRLDIVIISYIFRVYYYNNCTLHLLTSKYNSNSIQYMRLNFLPFFIIIARFTHKSHFVLDMHKKSIIRLNGYSNCKMNYAVTLNRK